MRPYRASIVAALIAAAASAAAGTYSIRLSPFPTAEVADGRSQVTVSAQVISDGRAVPDGTQVVFETDLGSFRESVVGTTGGWARATFVAGGVPGIAHVKARVVTGDATGNGCEIELVKSREELSIARETLETTSTGSLLYANDIKILEGLAPNKGVTVRYRDLEIHADNIQIDLRSFTLKGRKATVRRGRRTTEYDSLYLDLPRHTGYGLTNFPTTRPDFVSVYPGGIAFTEPDAQNEPVVAQRRMRFGMVQIGKDGDQALVDALANDPFAMATLADSLSTIGSRKAVVYARREIQFHRADIFVNNAKVLKFPLFVVNLNNSSASPLVTDDLVNVNDNQIAVNYPHYLLLRPGLTSLLRFRTGERNGQGLSGSRGAFLDYELKWSKGDDMQGGFTFSGVGRSDWTAGASQFWRLSDRTSSSFEVASPGGRSLFGSGSLIHAFGQYSLGLRGSQTHTLSESDRLRNGFKDVQNYSLSLDRNPIRLKGAPLHLGYGLTANDSRSVIPNVVNGKVDGTRTIVNTGAGFTARAFSDSVRVDPSTTLNGSFSATKLFGPQTIGGGVGLNGALTLNHRFSSSTNAMLTYNYLQDGVSEELMGRHSLSLNGNYALGNTSLSLWLTKGVAVDRMNVSGEASYRLNSLWRVGYSHFLTQFAGTNLTEYYYVVGYRIGWREVGVTWSNRTKRPGIQLSTVNF